MLQHIRIFCLNQFFHNNALNNFFILLREKNVFNFMLLLNNLKLLTPRELVSISFFST